MNTTFTKNKKWTLGCLLAGFFSLTAFAAAQSLADLPAWTLLPPEKPVSDVFIEGEDFTKQEGGRVTVDEKCYGGKNWTLYSKTGGGSVTYNFRVSKTGPYLIAVAGQEFGTGWTSPVSFAVGGTEADKKWQAAGKSPVSVNAWGASKSIKWTFLSVVTLDAGEHTLSIRIDKPRAMDANHAYAVDAVAIVFEPAKGIPTKPASSQQPPTGLTPKDVSSFVTISGQKTRLEWDVPASVSGESLAFTVVDYQGNKIRDGKAQYENELAHITLVFELGYHEIEFPFYKKSFGVIALPENKNPSDRFFAMDSALSWLLRNTEKDPAKRLHLQAGLIKMLPKIGVFTSRERLSWGPLQSEEGKWSWETGDQFESLRKIYQENGIKVLEVFHSTPGWLKSGKNPYPNDLVKASESWKTIGKRWEKILGSLEVWNEPDLIAGGDLPPAFYAPLVKTIAYTFQKEAIKIPVVGGVFAYFSADYLNDCTRNGIMETSDIMSYHTYDPAGVAEFVAGQYRRYIPDRALWLTETGRAWKKGPPRPPVDEDQYSALDIAAKVIEAKASGVAVCYPFVFPYYEENHNNFGMTGKECTPLRSLAAYAQVVRALSGKDYVGDLRFRHDSVIRARVFSGDDSAVAILYNPKPNDQAVPFPEISKVTGVEDIDGRKLPVKAALDLSGGLTYLWLKKSELAALIDPDTRAAELLRASKKVKTSAPKLSPLILEPRLEESTLAIGKAGANIPLSQKDPRLSVRIWNLSDTPQTASLSAELPKGFSIAGPLPSQSVPAKSFVDMAVTLALPPSSPAFEQKFFSLKGKDSANLPILPLSLPLQMEYALEDYLKDGKSFPIKLNPNDDWSQNIAPGGKMTISATAENHWHLQTEFPKDGDNWVYPEMPFPKISEFTPESYFLIRAKATGSAYFRVMLTEESGTIYYTTRALVPPDGAFHVVLLRFLDFTLLRVGGSADNQKLDLDQIKKLSIGFNGKTPKSDLTISDVLIVNAK